jgi:predicted ATPase
LGWASAFVAVHIEVGTLRIDQLHVDNFLSFDEFSWNNLDPHLNVIVGANGAGKTNLVNALRALLDAVRQANKDWALVAHQGIRSQPTTISVDLEFTGEWEKYFLATFFVAAFLNERVIQQAVQNRPRGGPPFSPESLARFSSQQASSVKLEDFAWLYKGRLVASFDGLRWHTYFESRPGEPPFFLSLSSSRGNSVFFGHRQSRPWHDGSLFGAWVASLDSEPDPTDLDKPAQVPRQTPEKDAVLDLFAANAEGEVPSPNFGSLPGYVIPTAGVSLLVEAPTQTALESHRLFAHHAGITLDSGRFYDTRWVFQRILEHSLIFTDNLRQPPRYEYSLDELSADDIDIASGVMLPLFLFHLKNGGVDANRNPHDDVKSLFQTLTNRTFDVTVRRDANSARQSREDRGLLLDITIGSGSVAVPLEYGGAGIAESLYLSAVIEGADQRILMLDEPASNLHPLVQTKLLQELDARTQSQCIVITHSPILISPERLTQVSRFYSQGEGTRRAALDLTHMDREQAEKVRFFSAVR